MAEVQDKLVDLKGLKAVHDAINTVLKDLQTKAYALNQNKLNTPKVDGTIGQVLALKDDEGTTEWKDLPAAPTTDNIRQIVNEQLAKTKYTINDQGHLIIETPEA